MNIAIFVSGRGSNLEAILKAKKQGFLDSNFYVISNNQNAKALDIAKHYDTASFYFEPKPKSLFEENALRLLKEKNIDFIVLAGFMAILSKDFIKEYPHKIINIHPSLLPAFKGINVHKRVIESGAKFSGATVHFVTEEIDAGCIIAQAITPIDQEDTETTLEQKVLNLEHKLLPQVIKWIEQGRVFIKDKKAYVKDAKYGSYPFNPELEWVNNP
ncbi:MAG: phosphoribosylglycinamide formyltransferase [Hydrogenobaculum sp.]|nr:MAG: phosphoribosylglycinamide formyltransferase [Hydrogenobaculum sp.]